MSGGAVPIRVVDALMLAQSRMEKYLKRHALEVGQDDDLLVAEAGALISIAQSLRVLAGKKMAEQPDTASVRGPVTQGHDDGCTCYAVQDAGGGRNVEREHCPLHRQRGPLDR